jgi:hypothetical protein
LQSTAPHLGAEDQLGTCFKGSTQHGQMDSSSFQERLSHPVPSLHIQGHHGPKTELGLPKVTPELVAELGLEVSRPDFFFFFLTCVS